MCFFTIGLVSNFKKLMQEGLGKLAAVYCISLFGFIIWVGLFICAGSSPWRQAADNLAQRSG